jgi:magnesium-transporting ATPase (P-type)
MILKQIAQKRLLILWCFGGLFLFIILIIQTVGDIYGLKVDEAWSWFLPTVIPTLTLMITVAIIEFSQSTTATAEQKQSDRFLFQLAFWLSLLYLVLVTFTLLRPRSIYTPIEWMKKSNLWLGPLQGLVTASLGAFFIKTSKS